MAKRPMPKMAEDDEDLKEEDVEQEPDEIRHIVGLVSATAQDLPGNSISAPEKPIAKKKIKALATGRVKKPGFIESFSQTFFGEDARTVVEYVFKDVLLPAARNTIVEMFSTGLEMLVFGDSRPRSRRRERDDGRPRVISYASMYDRRDSHRRDRDDDRDVRPRHRAGRLEPIIFEERDDAKEVLRGMMEILEEYGSVSRSNLYELANIPDLEFTNAKWGWESLRDAGVQLGRDGWELILPKEVPLE